MNRQWRRRSSSTPGDSNSRRQAKKKARRLIGEGKASLVSEDPLTVQLAYTVDLPVATEPTPVDLPGKGKRLLLHVCCAPCGTYSVERFRELGFTVSGLWYNPNVHPFSEHEHRRQTLVDYAAQVDLPLIQEPGYEVVAFMRAIQGHERFRERCAICYQLRLGRTALVAAREGFDAFSTTLLISPYQDQDTIRIVGEHAAAQYGVAFVFENLRRGWAAHHQMVRDCELYSQRYCGCLYSEWEALDRHAETHPRTP